MRPTGIGPGGRSKNLHGSNNIQAAIVGQEAAIVAGSAEPRRRPPPHGTKEEN